ncbi:MAG: nucleoside triphosphate pyrophosphohydrolase [Gemmatimonadetes bacterium]|nr:nucleoside triphosphate pyrophosphohydrolase [Gemmatimonadota bacterium]
MSSSSPNRTSLDDALAIMRDLRTRDAWDKAQTHESLRPYLNEEAHELDDALRTGDDAQIRSELGDVLLQVLFHAIIAEERGAFDISDVAGSLVRKMTVRHPWLYGDGASKAQSAGNASDATAPLPEREPWEQMKSKSRATLAEGLPVGLPSLHRAHRLQERAAGVGFDWPDVRGPADKVREELAEVEEIIAEHGTAFDTHGVPSADPRHAALESELGDLLFAVVNLCRKTGVHPSLALDKANAKFQSRFEAIEKLAAARGIDVRTAGLEALDKLWDEVKSGEG